MKHPNWFAQIEHAGRKDWALYLRDRDKADAEHLKRMTAMWSRFIEGREKESAK